MVIQLKSNQYSGLQPHAQIALEQIKDMIINSSKRHPLAIYNLSFSRILNNFEDVINSLNNVQKIDITNPEVDIDSKPHKLILKNQYQLLYSLMEHMDDCKNVLKQFYSNTDEFKKSIIVKEFNNNIDEYRNFIGKIVNNIKHEQGRLRFIILINEKSQYPGYFVEGNLKENHVGPNPLIHENSNTAFSFSRDLKFHFVNLMFVSFHLAIAIVKINNLPDISVVNIITNDKRLNEITKKISSLPYNFYNDEITKPIPGIKLKDISENNEIELELRIPDHDLNIEKIGGRVFVYVEYEGDSVTKHFELPYK